MSSSVESTFKTFIQHKSDFLQAAHACAKFADVDETGVPSRPVVVVSEADYPTWIARVEKWKALVEELSSYDAKRFPPSSADLYPVPFIHENVRGVRISITTATVTRNYVTTDILKRIDTALKKATKEGNAAAIKELNADKERFLKYKPDHRFRARQGGYSDMQAALYVIGQSKREIVHVSAHGLFVREKNLDSTGVERSTPQKRYSVYEHIKPLPCQALQGRELYDIDLIEAVTADYEERVRADMRRANVRKAQRKLKNKLKLEKIKHTIDKPTDKD
ncbi:TPA: hypothetical protein ACOEHI_003885 [Enterobacter kobei]|uniref:hypothetical protein n=1 Tax=Enterobacter kobei TaxID=208224 RepID=UPI0021C08509|nr:hypothetical protein [Enterobacter kobei]UXJ66682.1 hypothetical protein N5P26_22690 [Enterobacter kobei]